MISYDGDVVYIHHYDSPLGRITMAGDGDSLTGLWFDGQAHFGSTVSGDASEKDLDVFDETVRWLDTYFKGKDPGFTPSLNIIGTEFRREIADIMLGIPYGDTVSYGGIAKIYSERTGKRMSSQAVGNAVGHNPIAIIVPCHRVVGSKGEMTGYAGGIERKKRLLELEGHVL